MGGGHAASNHPHDHSRVTVVLIGWMSLATAARAARGFDPYAGPPLNTAAWKTSGSGGMRCTDCLDARGYKDIKNKWVRSRPIMAPIVNGSSAC